MTFSIVGRCAETGQLGIAISSSSIAVGARCPWLRSGVGAVSSQNITLPALGPQVLDGLGEGLAPAQALDQALTRNGYSQYRQVAVVDARGARRCSAAITRWASTTRWPVSSAWRPATCWPTAR